MTPRIPHPTDKQIFNHWGSRCGPPARSSINDIATPIANGDAIYIPTNSPIWSMPGMYWLVNKTDGMGFTAERIKRARF